MLTHGAGHRGTSLDNVLVSQMYVNRLFTPAATATQGLLAPRRAQIANALAWTPQGGGRHSGMDILTTVQAVGAARRWPCLTAKLLRLRDGAQNGIARRLSGGCATLRLFRKVMRCIFVERASADTARASRRAQTDGRKPMGHASPLRYEQRAWTSVVLGRVGERTGSVTASAGCHCWHPPWAAHVRVGEVMLTDGTLRVAGAYAHPSGVYSCLAP